MCIRDRGGRIVEWAVSTPEESAHRQLLDVGGEYFKLYTIQFRQEESQLIEAGDDGRRLSGVLRPRPAGSGAA